MSCLLTRASLKNALIDILGGAVVTFLLTKMFARSGYYWKYIMLADKYTYANI